MNFCLQKEKKGSLSDIIWAYAINDCESIRSLRFLFIFSFKIFLFTLLMDGAQNRTGIRELLAHLNHNNHYDKGYRVKSSLLSVLYTKII